MRYGTEEVSFSNRDDTRSLLSENSSSCSSRRVALVFFTLICVAGIITFLSIVFSPSDLTSSDNTLSCRHAVVGAGYGGLYYIWRLALSEHAIFSAADFCIYEASPSRIGGRAYMPENPMDSTWSQYNIDVGSYRFSTTQELITTLVHEFQFNTSCWANFECDTSTYYTIVDEYKNDKGHGQVLFELLRRFRLAGGKEVEMDHELVNITTSGDSSYPTLLHFANGNKIKVNTVLLNIPKTAIEQFLNNSLLTTASPAVISALTNIKEEPLLKYYLFYPDAWWITKLNITSGKYRFPDAEPPIEVQIADGPVRCVNPADGTEIPATTGVPTCYGALRIAYESPEYFNLSWYQGLFDIYPNRTRDEVSIFLERGQGYDYWLDYPHAGLMEIYRNQLESIGISPDSISPPTAVRTAYWNVKYGYSIYWYPSWSQLWVNGESNPDPKWEQKNLIIFPLPNSDIFIANEAFIQTSFAEGSLILVDRILSTRYNLPKPVDVSDNYWNYQVIPFLPPPLICQTDNNCQQTDCAIGKCINQKCQTQVKVDSSCPLDDPCLIGTCDIYGNCQGVPVVCTSPSICVGGVCILPEPPALPNCSVSVGQLNLWWEFPVTNPSSIRIAYQLPGSSYVGLGFGPTTSMSNADIILGWVKSDGSFLVEDYYSYSSGAPLLDKDIGGQNNLINTWASFDGAKTTVWLERLLDTGDSFDYVIKREVMTVIYAWNTGSAGTLSYHGPNKASLSVDFSTC